MNLTSYKNIIKQSIIPLFYFLIIMKFLQKEGGSASTIFTVGFITIGLISLFFMWRKIKINSAISITIFLLIINSFIISLMSSNYRVADSVLCIQYFGVALIPLLTKLNYLLFKIINYTIVLFFLFCIVKGIAPDEIFSVSRNFISVILLVGTGYQIISSYQNQKKPNLILLLLSLIIVIWSLARSGTIIYISLLIFYPFILDTNNRNKILYLIIIVFTSVFFINYFSETLFSAAFYRFKNMGIEDVRSTMNKDYLDTTTSSIFYIFTGTPLTMIKSMAKVEYNPHNSFIRLHIFYGLFGFLIVIFSIIYSLIQYFKYKKYILLVLLLVLLFRTSVDSTDFHGPLDPLLLFLIFLPFKNINILYK